MTLDEIVYIYCVKEEAIYKNGVYLTYLDNTPTLLLYVEKNFGVRKCNCNGYCIMNKKDDNNVDV